MPSLPTSRVTARPQAARKSARKTTTAATGAAGLCLAMAMQTAGPASAAPDTPASAATRIAEVQRTLHALSRKIETTVEDYNEARVTLAAAQRTAAAAAINAERARLAYHGKRTKLSGYAASAYRSGPEGSLAAIVTSTPAEYLDRLATLDAVGHRQAEMVRVTDEARQQYAGQVVAVDAASRAAAKVTQRIAAAKASIEAQIASQRGILAGLQADRARLRAEAARQQAARDAAAAAASRRQARAIGTVAGATVVARSSATRTTRSVARSVSAQSAPARAVAARSAPVSGRAKAAVAAAYSRLSRPYVYGAAGPNRFDCSGLTMWSWARAGVSLPHSSRAQYRSGRRVSRAALKPGDLLFFYSPISHVSMYIGGGRMISAPRTGDVVKIATPQWGRFVGAVRPG